jgi:hypothetical protein
LAKQGGCFRSFLHNKTILKQKIKSNNCLGKVLTTQTKKGHFWQNDLLEKCKNLGSQGLKILQTKTEKSSRILGK